MAEIDYTDALDGIQDTLDTILNNQLAIGQSQQQIASTVQNIGRALGWADLLLVILVVVLMLALGAFLGYQFSKYLRTRNADG